MYLRYLCIEGVGSSIDALSRACRKCESDPESNHTVVKLVKKYVSVRNADISSPGNCILFPFFVKRKKKFFLKEVEAKA